MDLSGSNGDVSFTFHINDTTLACESVHVTNNGPRTVGLTFLDENELPVFTANFAPGFDGDRNIPPGQQVTAFQHVVNRPDGSTKTVTDIRYTFGDLNAQAQGGGGGPLKR